jgi:hypothetical protein
MPPSLKFIAADRIRRESYRSTAIDTFALNPGPTAGVDVASIHLAGRLACEEYEKADEQTHATTSYRAKPTFTAKPRE